MTPTAAIRNLAETVVDRERADGYDANQRAAVLLACAICARFYFVTQPVGWRVCAQCR